MMNCLFCLADAQNIARACLFRQFHIHKVRKKICIALMRERERASSLTQTTSDAMKQLP